MSASAIDVEIASVEGTRTMSGLQGLIVIGRADGSSVLLKHDDVSRRHASVELAPDGGIVVRDLSTNGTFVDGKRVMGALKLPFGKPIQVGPFTLRFKPPGAAASARSVAGGIVAKAPPEPPKKPEPEPSVLAENAVVVEEAPKKKEPDFDRAAPKRPPL